MGSSASKPDREGKERSAEIDRALEAASMKKRGTSECKVLVLGSPGAGKTTIIKQVKIMHLGGFSGSERARYRTAIYRNVVESGQAIAEYIQSAGLTCSEEDNQELLEMILEFKSDARSAFGCVSPDILYAVERLWNDPVCSMVLADHTNEVGLIDSAKYFLSEIKRISESDYVPTNEDVLRAKEKSVGVEETTFEVANLVMHMFDVSAQRGDPRKWIHCFENVDGVFFCMALSDYDDVVTGAEDRTRNRLAASLVLFESVVNSRWFRRSSVTLFLNKMDVFEEKLARVPMKNYFPDYMGGPDVSKATQYILSRCHQANRARLKLHPHFTRAIDSKTTKAIFESVEEEIMCHAAELVGPL